MMTFNAKLYYYLESLFCISPESLMSVLTKNKAMIAGGFASFIYSNIDIENYDGDIDIWIPINEELKSKLLLTINKIKIEFEQLLSNYDKLCEYNFTTKQKNNNYIDIKDNYYTTIKNKNSNLSDIIYMVKFKNDNNKDIQLIFTDQTNLNVLSHFDLSFCSIGYDGENILNIEQELSYHKIGYIVNRHMHTNERIIKYQNRGYKIFDDRESAVKELVYIHLQRTS